MSRRRLRAVVAALAAALAVCGLQAVRVMVFQHSRWTAEARRQQQREVRVPSRRGSIVSADGYLMAASVDRVTIQVDSEALDYPELFANAAAAILGQPRAAVAVRLERRWSWIAQQVPREKALRVRALAPAAVALVPDSARVYPLGTVAAPLLGFVGREAMATVGRWGLEQRFDASLTGTPSTMLAVYDAGQRRLQLQPVRRGRPGADLELTISARLQAACEEELEAVRHACRARSAAAVVMDPATGDLLALVSLPSYDPARPAAADRDRWRLRPVQDAWEPGSTVKPLVVAAALSAGAVRRGERFDCRQRGLRFAGRWIRDHAEPGVYTLDQALAYSSNAAMVTLAGRLGPGPLTAAFRAFGFGNRPGLRLPGETAGLLPDASRWSRLTPAGLALGEELTVSPLQLATAYAAIANGGWLVAPRLVRTDPPRTPHVRVLGPRLARRLVRMMELVVAEGTGELAAVPGYRAAGKTGTAQRAVGGRLDDEHHVAWFAGFLPLPRPRAVVVVALEQPRGDYWASTTAAPAFSRLAEATMRELRIPPQPRLIDRETRS